MRRISITLFMLMFSVTFAMAQSMKPEKQNSPAKQSEAEKDADFWTPERLDQAKPMPLPKLTREQFERLTGKKQ
jgi:hypothetical protein